LLAKEFLRAGQEIANPTKHPKHLTISIFYLNLHHTTSLPPETGNKQNKTFLGLTNVLSKEIGMKKIYTLLILCGLFSFTFTLKAQNEGMVISGLHVIVHADTYLK